MRAHLKLVILACLPASAISTLAVYPHDLAYFNELSGGPLDGHRHLRGTSADLGQDVLIVREWMQSHAPAPGDVRVAGGIPENLPVRNPVLTLRHPLWVATRLNQSPSGEDRWQAQVADSNYRRVGYVTLVIGKAPAAR